MFCDITLQGYAFEFLRRVCFAGKSNEEIFNVIYLKVSVIVAGGCLLVTWQYNPFVYKMFESSRPLFLAYSQIFFLDF
jgi:hypothetical protein